MLEKRKRFNDSHRSVSVAGCLGYDVLGEGKKIEIEVPEFQLLVV